MQADLKKKYSEKTLNSGGYLLRESRVRKTRISLQKALSSGFVLTPEMILRVLVYEADTGKFYWKVPPRRGVSIGTEAGSISHGYTEILLYGARCLSHWLVWFLETGQWPISVTVDHINRDRSDNRFSNLRECSQQQNCYNSVLAKKSRIGLRGVSRHKLGLWRARVGKTGCWYFKTPEEAHQKYLIEVEKLAAGFLPETEKSTTGHVMRIA